MSSSQRRVGVIGGGLAGLAAAVSLADHGWGVELFEARRQLGGRAGSFDDPESGEVVDHCQHVGMGCCTNLADFCRRLGIEAGFRRDRVIHFFGPDGRQFPLRAAPLLPAPLHLGPSFLRLGYLSWRERRQVASALWQLARSLSGGQDTARGQKTVVQEEGEEEETIGNWLRRHGQSEQALRRFWAVVLVSALGESLDRASVSAARKVFVDGFLAAREAYVVSTPIVPLAELYGRPVIDYLARRGGRVHCGTTISGLQMAEGESSRLEASRPVNAGPQPGLLAASFHAHHGLRTVPRVASLQRADGACESFDAYVLALPWRRIREVLPPQAREAIPILDDVERIESAPITAIHIWLDREIMSLPHAVLIDRLSQWVFRHDRRDSAPGQECPGHYYQVVISASRELAGRSRQDVLDEVLSDLSATWPAARDARLLRWRIVTQQDAVFSVRPGLDSLRPGQQTAVGNLFLAGDWTRTGWPATMEGAVRSGYLAAQALLRSTGQPDATCLVPDLPRNWLSRWLLSR